MSKIKDKNKKITDDVTPQFFFGGIPPFLLFEMEFHSLSFLVESHKSEKLFKKINPATEVAWIGIVAYFEAFCKHQFAAIINIAPSLLHSFSLKREQTTVNLSDILSLYGKFEKTIGFFIAEQYDFGSAKTINSLFRDLLSVSPFSTKESEQLNAILSTRHLLVHHAGIYTLQYLKKNSIPSEIEKKVFRDSILISTKSYHEMSDFLFDMAIKITRTTVDALKKKINTEGSVNKEQASAIDELIRGLYDNLD